MCSYSAMNLLGSGRCDGTAQCCGRHIQERQGHTAVNLITGHEKDLGTGTYVI